jgi:hypothetical protein
MATVPEEVLDILNRLPLAEQQRVLEYARMRAQTTQISPSVLPQGKPIKDFLAFRSSLDPETVDEMARAIEEGCERIESDDDGLSF